MLRASTTGLIDFSRFDPWDVWWWRKLKWTLDELEMQHHREVSQLQHTHWVTLASHSRLTEQSFDQAKTNAGAAMTRYMKATYPWLAGKIGEEGERSDREQFLEDYHKTFGRPGEPRYDAWLSTLHRVYKKGKLSPREKEQARKRSRARREAARQQQFAQ